jgi:tetratricopeptide (TPR) repeat protein
VVSALSESTGNPVRTWPPPRELPPDVYGFTGRSEELNQLDSLLAEQTGTPAAVSGTAGVGKTALAVHWAHRVADRFPDGQLYVDLRGYDPEQPMPAADALAAFLRALGVEGADVPAAPAERAARYRSLVAGRRLLVILDNAGSLEQVAPLVPGTGSCFVVVTSRDSLPGLVVRHGARRLDLDLLAPEEAVDLLRGLVGSRVDAEPGAAAELVRRCARLPLALRVAAEIAAARPTTPLTDLVAELADERGRLDVFQAGSDDRSAVRAVFWWSYRRLPAPAARMFRLLGLHPGTDADAYAAAALADTDLRTAQQLVDSLVGAHLVQEPGPGRYRMHDLLRTYAVERADEEAEPDRRAALVRLIHHYLSVAALAMDVLYPAERARRPSIAAPTGPVPPLDSTEKALSWLDGERDNLVSVAAYAAGHGWAVQAGYFARVLSRHLEIGAHYGDAMALHDSALRAAQDVGDRFGQANAHLGLGTICYWLGRYDEAAEHYQQSATMFREDRDPNGEIRALTNLGIIYAQWGYHDKALNQYRQALDGFRELGDRNGEAMAMGWVGYELGLLGRFEEAFEHLERALAMFRDIGDRMREAEVLYDLGEVHRLRGRYDEAFELIGRALEIGRETGDRYRQTDALNGLAEVLRATGRLDEALAHHGSALALARESGQRVEEARALDGIATILDATGHREEARRRWRDALALYTALSMPRAEDVRGLLTD